MHYWASLLKNLSNRPCLEILTLVHPPQKLLEYKKSVRKLRFMTQTLTMPWSSTHPPRKVTLRSSLSQKKLTVTLLLILCLEMFCDLTNVKELNSCTMLLQELNLVKISISSIFSWAFLIAFLNIENFLVLGLNNFEILLLLKI